MMHEKQKIFWASLTRHIFVDHGIRMQKYLVHWMYMLEVWNLRLKKLDYVALHIDPFLIWSKWLITDLDQFYILIRTSYKKLPSVMLFKNSILTFSRHTCLQNFIEHDWAELFILFWLHSKFILLKIFMKYLLFSSVCFEFKALLCNFFDINLIAEVLSTFLSRKRNSKLHSKYMLIENFKKSSFFNLFPYKSNSNDMTWSLLRYKLDCTCSLNMFEQI